MAENAAVKVLEKVAEEIGKDIASTVKRQLNILCCFSNNIDNMKEEAKRLTDKRDGLQIQVAAKERNMEIIVPEVDTWIEATEGMLKKKDEIENKIPVATAGCWTNMKAPFSLGNKVKITTEAMQKLREEVEKFNTISCPAPPPASIPIPMGPILVLQSRKQIEDDIVKVLSQPEVVNIVGVGGMGGVGKTTMAKRILNRMMTEKLVDEAVVVVVSQTLDMLKIQQDIAQSLGFKDLEKEGSLGTRARQLFSRLSNKKILIILDDIWEKFKLEDLGIPCEGGCITLLTSRNKHLLENQMGARVFAMPTLSTDEAWGLFKDKASTCVDDPHLVSIAKEVVDECKGLPVAIITIGSALKNKSKQIWDGALRQLKSSRPINVEDVIKDVYMPLRQSYELLDNCNAKLLFLLCCLYPEDHRIQLEDLVCYSVGLKMFEELNSLEEARYQVRTEIEKLKSRCLLLDGNNEDEVKMHDVIRDVAIFIASEEGLIDANSKTKGQYDKNCKWISVCTTLEVEPLDHFSRSNFQDLRLLLVRRLFSSKRWPEMNDISILKGMRSLNVLSFRGVQFRSPLEEVEWPNNLITVQFVDCSKLKTLHFIGDLLNLKILDCHECWGIEELPIEIGHLKCLKLLNLSQCEMLKRIAPGIIKQLVELEELKMLDSFSQWESSKVSDKEGMNVPLNELEALRKLRCLEIRIDDISLAHEQLDLTSNLVKYKIEIGRYVGGFNHENDIHLGGIPNEMINDGSWIRKLLATTTIERLNLDGDGSGNWGNLSRNHNTVKRLEISNCEMLKELLDSSAISTCLGELRIFPKLEGLMLNNLSNLRKLCVECLPSPTHILKSSPNQQSQFNNLQEVQVTNCDKLLNLFSLERANDAFIQLETLEIKNCASMEQVFILNESDEDENSGNTMFPKLKKLVLSSLPCLTTFWKGSKSIEFPSLETLTIKECDQLKSIVCSGTENESEHNCGIDEAADKTPHLFCTGKVKLHGLKYLNLGYGNQSSLWCPQIPNSFFMTLESLSISGCHNIRSLFSSSMVKNLANLNHLHLWNCDLMEDVLRKEEDKDEGKTSYIMFPKLKTLELWTLPSLTSMCKGIDSIEFPMLKSLMISYCPKLKSIVWPKLDECNQESKGGCKNFDDPFHFSCDDKVKLDGLKSLTLSGFNNKSSIWCPQVPESFFKLLESLIIQNYHNMTSLFSSSMIEHLVNLNYLSVGGCDLVEEVLRKEKHKDEGKTRQIIFPKLKTLRLAKLPSLTSVGKGIKSIEFPMLERLEIECCPKLKSIICATLEECNEESREGCSNSNVDEPFHVLCDDKVKFNSLKDLQIDGCHVISSLFSSLAVGNLTTLTKIRIEKMPWLGNVCEWKCPLELSMLEEVIVADCPLLKFLTSGSLSTPKLRHMRIDNKYFEDEEWVITKDLNKFVCQHVMETREVWKIGADVFEASQLNTLLLPHEPHEPVPLPLTNVVRLLYTNYGHTLVAVSSNASPKMWDLQYHRSSTSYVPKLQQLIDESVMSNDLNNAVKSTQVGSIACVAVFYRYMVSASGGTVTLFDMFDNFKVIKTFMTPPPVVTYLAFDPEDFNVIAVGMDDSTIQIYDWRAGEVKTTLEGGHQKRISGIAFSRSWNILVSSSVDAKLCVWSIHGWERKKSQPIQAPLGHQGPLDGETRVQFHKNEYHLLVVHKSQIAIYNPELECIYMWYPRDSLPSPVSCATYSGDGRMIYIGFYDGAVGIFDLDHLTLLCRIAHSAYISSPIPCDGNAVPMVMDIAAHPKDPNQFALGMRGGAIYIIKPSDAETKSEESIGHLNS